MFAYYGKWTPEFSDKIQPLVKVDKFPFGEKALNTLKSEVCKVTLWAIVENLPPKLDCDSSDYT